MLKNIAKLKGTKELSKTALKNVNGGLSAGGGDTWSCIRTDGQGQIFTFHTDNQAVMEAWSEAWASLGWATNCQTMER